MSYLKIIFAGLATAVNPARFRSESGANGDRKNLLLIVAVLSVPLVLGGCTGAVSTDEIVRVEEIHGTEQVAGLGESEREVISRLRESSSRKVFRSELEAISSETQKLTIEEYLGRFHDPVNSNEIDYKVGGRDVLNIIVYDFGKLKRIYRH